MRVNKSLILAAIAALLAVTVIAFTREGLAGMKTPFNASFWTWQYFIDLAIALGIVMIWMWHDCRRRGKSAIVWILATFITGALAPLIYLLLRQPESTPEKSA